ncbi:MAG: protein kinase [Planctomycetes bacterium]|nr:protein kinase [Planctomycetota bacterium]
MTCPPSSASDEGDFGPYRIIRLIGRGAMGVVHEAVEVASGHRLALKRILLPDVEPEARERFLREAKCSASIDDPHCVFVLAGGVIEDTPYLALELLPGETLEKLVKARGALPPREALLLMLDVCDGLAAVHAADIIHRDVKPANCLLTADGRVKVGDFGLSRTISNRLPDLTVAGRMLGTPAFAAPEQLRGEPVDARADVYGACATLFFLLTGVPPFQGNSYEQLIGRVLTEAPPRLRNGEGSGIPTAIEDLLQRGLAKDRAQRPQSMQTLRRRIAAAMPERQTQATVLERVVAFAADLSFLTLLLLVANMIWPDMDLFAFGWRDGPLRMSILAAVAVAYYGLLEGSMRGASLGKLWVGLRMGRASNGDKLGLPRAAIRGAVFVLAFTTYEFAARPLFAVVDPVVAALLGQAYSSLELRAVALPLVTVLAYATPVVALFLIPWLRGARVGLHDLLVGSATFRVADDVPTTPGEPALAPVDLSWATCTPQLDPFLDRHVLVVPRTAAMLDRPDALRVAGEDTPSPNDVRLVVPQGSSLRDWIASGPHPWSHVRVVMGTLAAIAADAESRPDPAAPLDTRQIVVGQLGRTWRLPVVSADAPRPIAPSEWLAASCRQLLAICKDDLPLRTRIALTRATTLADIGALRAAIQSPRADGYQLTRARRFFSLVPAAALFWSLTLIHYTLQAQLREVQLERLFMGATSRYQLAWLLENAEHRESLFAAMAGRPRLAWDWQEAFGVTLDPNGKVPEAAIPSLVHTLQAESRALWDRHAIRTLDYRRTALLMGDSRHADLADYVATGIAAKVAVSLVVDARSQTKPDDTAWDSISAQLLWAVHQRASGADPLTAPSFNAVPSGAVLDWLSQGGEFDASIATAADRAAVTGPRRPALTWFPILLLGGSVLLSFLTRGQFVMRRAGLAIVGPDLVGVSRLRAAIRAGAVVAPACGCTFLAEWVDARWDRGGLVCGLLYVGIYFVTLTFPLLAFRDPSRLPHDRLAGTRVVPW